MERMDEYRMARGSGWETEKGPPRGGAGANETESRLVRWYEGDLGQQRNDVEAARQCTKDREEWRAPVHM